MKERITSDKRERAAIMRKVRRIFETARNEYREAYRGHWSHAVNAGLEAVAASGVLGIATFGVESYRGATSEDEYARRCDVLYLNAGDTYDETLVFDNERAQGYELKLACWGDYAERFPVQLDYLDS